MDEKKSFFELIDGKTAMIIGFIAAVLFLGTVGFAVLGFKLFYGGNLIAVGNTANPAPTPAAPTVAAQPQAPAAPAHVDVGNGHFPVKGDAKAKVTLVEFADFRCPFCQRFYNESEKAVMRDYVAAGKVKYYFRGYAFLGPASTAASEAAECANEQGQFWKFHDWMYEHQADESNTAYYSKDNLIKYAADLGMNKAKFTSCLNSDKYAAQVSQDLSEGQAAGVNGTPTTFVNGTALVGALPYSQVKAAIDQALAQAQ